jgi:glycosyltransferase involved in cell wall biosynthesis
MAARAELLRLAGGAGEAQRRWSSISQDRDLHGSKLDANSAQADAQVKTPAQGDNDLDSVSPQFAPAARCTRTGIRGDPLEVSVIIPTHNAEERIAALLEALAATEDCGWELIVVDDGSTDATVRIVRELATRPEQTQLIAMPINRGKATAVNLGVAQARFEKLVFLDDDDRPAPGYLRALASALEKSEFVCSMVRLGALNRSSLVAALFRPGIDYFAVPFRKPKSSSSGLEYAPVSMGGTLAVRRRTLRRVGGFNPEAGVSDDLDLCLRLWLLDVVLETEPEATLDYRLRTGTRELFCQRLQYGRGWAWLYENYRSDGIVRPTWLATITGIARAQVQILLRSPRSAYKAAVSEVGFAIGLAMGSRPRF